MQIKDGDCGHYIFEGPPGVGKRTMICALLREVFGAEKIQVRNLSFNYKIPNFPHRSTLDYSIFDICNLVIFVLPLFIYLCSHLAFRSMS